MMMTMMLMMTEHLRVGSTRVRVQASSASDSIFSFNRLRLAYIILL